MTEHELRIKEVRPVWKERAEELKEVTLTVSEKEKEADAVLTALKFKETDVTTGDVRSEV